MIEFWLFYMTMWPEILMIRYCCDVYSEAVDMMREDKVPKEPCPPHKWHYNSEDKMSCLKCGRSPETL